MESRGAQLRKACFLRASRFSYQKEKRSSPAKRDGKSFWYNLIEKPLNHRLKKKGCSLRRPATQ
jgi:hypothetical protein